MFPFCENSSQDQPQEWASIWGFWGYYTEKNLENMFSRKCGRVEGTICEVSKNYNLPFSSQLAFLSVASTEQQHSSWVATGTAVRKGWGWRQRPGPIEAVAGAGIEVVSSKDSSAVGRSTYSKLFLIEQIGNHIEDNRCCVSHCQRQYLKRAPRCWVRTESIIMNPWFYHIHTHTHREIWKHLQMCIYVHVGGGVYFFFLSTGRVSFSSITKMKGYTRVILNSFQH